VIILLRPGFAEIQVNGERFRNVPPDWMVWFQNKLRKMWKAKQADVQFVQTGIAYEVEVKEAS